MQTYVLTPLAHPPVSLPQHEYGYTAVYGINNQNQVVGYASREAARWDGTELVALPTVRNGSYGFDINESGAVTGMFHLAYPTRAYVIRDGVFLDISTMLPGADSAAVALNDAGVVVGRTGDFDGGQPFIYDSAAGRLTLLPPLPGHVYAMAYAINNAGTVAGISKRADESDARVFHHRNGQTTDCGAASEVNAINSSDVACGSRTFEAIHPARAYRAVLGPGPAAFEDLGHSPQPGLYNSRALDINEHGVVVGYSYGSQNHVMRAFVHYPAGHPDAGFHDLEPQVRGADGWELETAMGINDRGVIVGNGTYLGESRSFVLHPVRQREVDRILSFITLFGGVSAGGAGTGIIPGGPPVPIPSPLWHDLHPAQRDLHLSAALDNLATTLGGNGSAELLHDTARRIRHAAATELRRLTAPPLTGSADTTRLIVPGPLD